MTDVLARLDDALSPDEITTIVRDRLGDVIVDSRVEFRTFTLTVAPEHWFDVARVCRDEQSLAFDMFDCLFGIDAREDGFDVVAVLYSTSTGNRISLRTRCSGGREAPTCPSITELYRGADWMERETWDMFGIEFDGHPGLAPRLLTVENFEGWPLRKDFTLTARVAKAWPGVKEPVELDEDGNVIERVTGIGDAPGPYDLDKAMAEQARVANPRSAGDEPEDPAGGAAAGDTEAAEGDGAPADDDASAVDDGATATDGDTDDAGAQAPAAAQQKADDRRREQADARRRRAAERAADDAGAGDDAEGSDGEEDA